MRRPRRRHVVLAVAYAVVVYPIVDYVYWHRRGGAFNHR